MYRAFASAAGFTSTLNVLLAPLSTPVPIPVALSTTLITSFARGAVTARAIVEHGGQLIVQRREQTVRHPPTRPWCAERGRTLNALAQAWLLAQPQVCSVISGATTLEHVTSNALAAGWTLTADELASVNAILNG